jgi:hypothetical protein
MPIYCVSSTGGRGAGVRAAEKISEIISEASLLPATAGASISYHPEAIDVQMIMTRTARFSRRHFFLFVFFL